MSELPRISPVNGTTIPPVRPTRKPRRERKKSRDEKPPERDRSEEDGFEPDDPTEDEPGKGGSINLRV